MIAYEHVSAPVRKAFTESHQRFWVRLAAPGTWWTGDVRVAIAREARAARTCPYCRERTAALSPQTVSGSHATASDLSAVHYLANIRVRDPSAAQGSLSRPEMDLVAGKVSMLNDCYY